jgi:hypothetical protein
MKKQELAKVEKQQLSTAVEMDFAADAGMGLEGADKDTYAIPFLSILQGLSPQIETVDGARPGLFINTITDELFKEVKVIPVSFQRRFLRWAPRSEGGGFKGEYSPIDVETGKVEGLDFVDGKYLIGKDQLKDTRNHFLLVHSDRHDTWNPAMLSLTSTQIKKSKRWMSLINGIELRTAEGRSYTPPSFSHIYKLSTIKEENSQGSWWGLEVSLDGKLTDADVYQKAKDFNRQVQSGDVKVQEPHSEEVSPHREDRF